VRGWEGTDMAGDMRTLTMQILAQTDQFSKGLKDAQTETESFSNKVGGFVASATKAFVAMGTAVGSAAVAIGVSAVKAAIDDQKETALLEQAVRNYTGASKEQVDAVNEYIDATERAAGVNSTEIIPSFERLLRTFKDVTKAQEIQKVAQDVAAGTGKSLTEVSDALARAYEGNTKGLKDLGIQLTTTQTVTKKVKVSKDDLTKSELNAQGASLALQSAQERLNKVLADSDSTALDVAKAQNSLEKAQLRASDSSEAFDKKQKNLGKTISETKDIAVPFDQLIGEITKKFEGSAAAAADTFAGRMEILRTNIGKAKEELGTALFPILDKISKFMTEDVVPAIQGVVDGLTGKKSIRQATIDAGGNLNLLKDDLNESYESGQNLGKALRDLAETIGLTGDSSGKANPEFSKFVDNVTKLVGAVNGLFEALQRLGGITSGVLDFVGLQGLIARVENAGERFRGEPTSGGQYGPTVNQTVIFNPLTTKDAAKKTLKSLNDASKTGNIGQFVKPMIPGR
jgi:hypothetical protein